MNIKSVTVIGLGYIGLPTAVLLAEHGCQVLGVDINPDVVNTINSGKVHIQEPGLAEMTRRNIDAGRIKASQQVAAADIFIIAVPTPLTQDKQPDISYIAEAVAMLAPHCKPGTAIILESTSPPGTTEKISRWIHQARPELRCPHDHNPADIAIAYCPERVMPGRTLDEFIHNDRVVGGISPNCTTVVSNFYRQVIRGQCLETDARTAEVVKLAENAYRDVNIAYANELSMLCEQLDVDVWHLIELANHHPRVNILQPGPGVGGHCIAVDPYFLIAASQQHTPLMSMARKVNLTKTQTVIDNIKQVCAQREVATIAILGLTFKADIDDCRESPAIMIAKSICKHFTGELLIAEPHIASLPEGVVGKLTPVEDCLNRADIIVNLVAHQCFKQSLASFNPKPEQILIDTVGVITHLVEPSCENTPN